MDTSFEGARLVGFEVEPFSVKHALTPDGSLATCSAAKPVTHDMPPQQAARTDDVLWTYDVKWE